MPVRPALCLLAYACLALLPNLTFASDPELLAQSYAGDGGGYLSWWKLLLVVAVFLLWVWMADWLNRDTQKLGEDSGLTPEVWNPLNLVLFLGGFFSAISIPIFFAGFPVMVACAFAAPSLYWMMRRGKLKADADLKIKAQTKIGDKIQMAVLPQDDGPDISFTPAGDKTQQQANLIRARQAPNFLELKELIHDCIKNRTEVLVIDYTQQAAAPRMQIDGTWHPLPPMDRPSGDALLMSLKFLAGLNPQDRQSQQQGRFKAKAEVGTGNMELTTRGVPTGEQAILKFDSKSDKVLTLNQLGMLPDTTESIKGLVNTPGLILVTSPPLHGLTTSYRGMLQFLDRITRDCIGLITPDDDETPIENITPHRFDPDQGQTPLSIMRKLLLTQPDCLIVRDITTGDVLDALVEQANDQSRTVVTQMKARSASEGLLRLFALSKNRKEFAKAAKLVTGQRLMRRLCDVCKVPVQVQPQVIQQLGGDPRKHNTIYQPYQLPPPEQQVDENGKPIEMQPCEACSGIGYIGRIAAFETMIVGDQVRRTLMSNPTVDAIEKAAISEGKRPISAEGYRLVLLGITSVAEVQRVMQAKS